VLPGLPRSVACLGDSGPVLARVHPVERIVKLLKLDASLLALSLQVPHPLVLARDCLA
jgi:hypothetical protein